MDGLPMQFSDACTELWGSQYTDTEKRINTLENGPFKKVCCTDQLHDRNFFLTNGNTDRDRITDQEDRYQHQYHNDSQLQQ